MSTGTKSRALAVMRAAHFENMVLLIHAHSILLLRGPAAHQPRIIDCQCEVALEYTLQSQEMEILKCQSEQSSSSSSSSFSSAADSAVGTDHPTGRISGTGVADSY